MTKKMRSVWIGWIAWCLLLPFLLSGQVPPSSGASSGGIVLGGKVMNAQTGEPLSKAEVRLVPSRRGADGAGSSFGARTGSDGAFAIRGIAPGEYLLTVQRRAFAAPSGELRGLPAVRSQGRGWLVTLRAGQSVSGVEILLPPAGVITGQVTDEEGEPMTGVVMEASQHRYVQGTKALVTVARGVTDDRGVYRIYDLAPGRYFVKAQGRSLRARLSVVFRGAGPGFGGGAFGGGPPGAGVGGAGAIGGFGGLGAPSDAELEGTAYPETFYPNALSPAEAIPLQLSAGAEMAAIDFSLRPSPTYSVSGRVILPEGATASGDRPGSAVFVTARPAGQPSAGMDASRMTPVNPGTGEFVLRGLMPGSYELIARLNSRRGGGGTGAAGVATVLVGSAPVNGVTIAVAEDVTLPGKVTLPAGSKTDQLSRMSIVPERRLMPIRNVARVDANGAFEITLSPAEPPRLAMNQVPDGLYVKRILLGGSNLLSGASGNPVPLVGTLTVELAADGASISGTARDGRGNPVANARISVIPVTPSAVPDSLARDLWKKSLTSAENGSFQFTGLAPGRYRVYCFESLDAEPSFDADFLSNFGQRWKELELKPNESATLEIAPIPAADTAMYLENAL